MRDDVAVRLQPPELCVHRRQVQPGASCDVFRRKGGVRAEDRIEDDPPLSGESPEDLTVAGSMLIHHPEEKRPRIAGPDPRSGLVQLDDQPRVAAEERQQPLDPGFVIPEVFDEGGVAVELCDPLHESLRLIGFEFPEVENPKEVVEGLVVVRHPGKDRRCRRHHRKDLGPLEYRPQRPDLAPIHLAEEFVDVVNEYRDLSIPGGCSEHIDRSVADQRVFFECNDTRGVDPHLFQHPQQEIGRSEYRILLFCK